MRYFFLPAESARSDFTALFDRFGPSTTSRTLKYTEPVLVTLGVLETFGAMVEIFGVAKAVLAISRLRIRSGELLLARKY